VPGAEAAAGRGALAPGHFMAEESPAAVADAITRAAVPLGLRRVTPYMDIT
jgi:hypothetical protein